ncbi:MAG TPA: MgtC/SapB family protein [Candidatus Limnocylindrales bacterium]|nr:MgtC/SapB family protein [Candidatus Limnocylindrales bacterium]
MPVDVGLQVELSGRLILAAALGALIGLEREIHQHPAGMRTHLLLALGAAAFTELSMFAFGDVIGRPDIDLDPSRVAAQIVSGIGFLGGGAIIKYGTSIRGLTTAASLWATASVGMAIGGGLLLLGVVAALVMLLSLGPLNYVVERLRLGAASAIRLRLALNRLEQLGEVSEELRRRRVEIAGIGTQRVSPDRLEVELDVRLPSGARPDDLFAALGELPNVEVMESAAPHD